VRTTGSASRSAGPVARGHRQRRSDPSLTGLQVPGQGAWTLKVWLGDAAGNTNPSNGARTLLHYLDGAGGGPKASALIALAKAKLDRQHRLVVRGTAAANLAHRLTIRYRYRPHKQRKLSATTRKATLATVPSSPTSSSPTPPAQPAKGP
jgi:hypothetical protein